MLASKPIVKKLYFSKRDKCLNMNKKIVCNFLFISFSAGQLVDYKSSYKNLTDAVEFAYQNNLNVLIEDFTGVG